MKERSIGMKTAERTGRRLGGAFTLIELLIVVAIIAILAAIAVPNFLEAQTRSKIARVKADQRSVATALEAYAVDYTRYPPDDGWPTQLFLEQYPALTTPVAYITSVEIRDPFATTENWYQTPNWKRTFQFHTYDGLWATWANSAIGISPPWLRRGCIVQSWGPYRKDWGLAWYPIVKNNPGHSWENAFHNPPEPDYIFMIYDATNGTNSAGNIGRLVGDLNCEEVLGQ